MKLIKVKAHIGYWIILLALSACRPAESEAVGKRVDADSVTVSVDAVNYMHDYSVQFVLRDAKQQAVGGSIVDILQGPGGKNCCTLLPKKWRAGLKYHLSWQEADTKEILPIKYQRTLEVPQYSVPGDLYVLFYPNHEVELIASPVEPGHANWAGREKAGALSACVARLSEKECRKHLPKYKFGSKEETAAMMREACTVKSIQESSDPEGNQAACNKLLNDCKDLWVINKKMCGLDYQE